MKKQTAVEWIEQQLIEGTMRPVEIIAIAKAMEKEQIIQANLEGQFHADGIKANTVAEQYYNETFNQ